MLKVFPPGITMKKHHHRESTLPYKQNRKKLRCIYLFPGKIKKISFKLFLFFFGDFSGKMKP